MLRRALEILEASLPDHHPWVQGVRENLEALLAEIEGAKAHLPEGPLTRPQGGHPLPRSPGELASLTRPHSQANAEGEREAPPRRGLLARMFGRR